jgi:hypothetical protein
LQKSVFPDRAIALSFGIKTQEKTLDRQLATGAAISALSPPVLRHRKERHHTPINLALKIIFHHEFPHNLQIGII